MHIPIFIIAVPPPPRKFWLTKSAAQRILESATKFQGGIDLKRLPFVLRLKPNAHPDFGALRPALAALRAENFSIWRIQDFLFCYGEYPDSTLPDALNALIEPLLGACERFADAGTLPLMYHDVGVVRADKSLIRHRVFATHLHPNCASEYKRRHDALIAARGDTISEGPESNFTIWNANGFIFGYCELVRAFDHEMTAEERASTIAWETRQLEIMDWLTDDVDWITGEKHDPVRLEWQQ